MKINIGLPANPIYDIFAGNLEKVKENHDINIYRLRESDCIERFLAGSLQAAFLSPLGYGMGVKKADFRVVPGPCISVEGYSGILSLYFNEGLSSIKSCMAPDTEDYLIILSKILLAERYGMEVEISAGKGEVAAQLGKADAVLAYGRDESIGSSMDMTEDWLEHFEQILPLGFWVTKAEDDSPEGINDILAALASEEMPRQVYTRDSSGDDDSAREGRILYFWDERIEEAFDQTLHLLYYHQYLPEIGAVKIFGQDNEAESL